LCLANPISVLTPVEGYTGDSLPLKIIIAFLLGLSLYNAIELIVLALVTFQRYHGLYFWSLVISAFGIIPYALGFIIKFFRILDPSRNSGYVGVVLLTLGWWPMITGGSTQLGGDSGIWLLTSS
jgi:membrane protein required for beta-lactamase induction